jgi:FlaA1/EpsC-like NDP-sugar epimerase
MLTLTEAIDLVFHSLKYSKGGEIFVKKAPSVKINDLAKAYAELKTGKKDYPLEYVGIRAGEKIDEVLVSHEEMRRAKEEKDHFVIHGESDFDIRSLKKSLKTIEYDSGSASHLSVKELKEIMKKLNWVL